MIIKSILIFKSVNLSIGSKVFKNVVFVKNYKYEQKYTKIKFRSEKSREV